MSENPPSPENQSPAQAPASRERAKTAGPIRKLFEILRLRRPVVPVLRLSGAIGLHGPVRRGLDMASLADPIARAFSSGVEAVAVVVNSPGGSPVQSALIHTRIRQLADERKLPVHAFVEDVAASGGYWLALAADDIHADENSIIGSIGVISAGFGFTGLLERIGVERRVHAQGERKGMLDPFRPENAEDVARLKAVQADMFESFKDLVRKRRGERLKAPEEQLFNGDIWTGRRAVENGLIDGLGDIRGVLRERYGDKVALRPVQQRPGFWRRRLGVGEKSALAVEAALACAEERALWARYGL